MESDSSETEERKHNMTNIITIITLITMSTNWHGVENTDYEVPVVTETTHLQYGTNKLLFGTETTVGKARLRKKLLTNAPEPVMNFTNVSLGDLWLMAAKYCPRCGYKRDRVE